jgi:polysaccharide biosynthesis transport protein
LSASNGLQETGRGGDLRSYLLVLWRRKLVILPLVVLLPLTTYFVNQPGPSTYEASATVLLNRQSQGASEIGDPSLWDPARNIRTQSELARLPEVAQRVVQADGSGDAAGFLASSSVGADPDNDFLIFRARDGRPEVAARLANLYATKYIEYRRELETNALREAQGQLAEQLEGLRRQGVSPTEQVYQSILERQQQLQTAETLQAAKAVLVRPADGAGEVDPGTSRVLLIALGLGLILGLGLAFAVETLDTRMRNVDELVKRLGLPLLGKIPAPARSLRRRRRLVMIDDPNSPAAEPYRMLRASLDMARGADSRVLMVTSAVEAEGKSTTAANLAVAMARAGRHVILVDLDLYRPGVERWFQLPATPGLTDVALAGVPLEDAVRRISLRPFPNRVMPDRAASENGHGRAGRLEVLTRGTPPESPGEFITTEEFRVVLERLRHRADLVIVDGPPLVLSGDAVMLSATLDAMLVVARLNVLRQGQVRELDRLLASSPAAKLGVVVTGASPRGGGYHYYRYHGREVGERQRQLAD